MEQALYLPEKILPGKIAEALRKIKSSLIEKFGDNLLCLLLYGSWVKGLAREDSDIDLLAIFKEITPEIERSLLEIEKVVDDRNITIVPATVEDFEKERLPLFTAVKHEGRIIYGEANLSINPEDPLTKYANFFERSADYEKQKVEIAEELLAKGIISSIGELCFVAAKHAVQAALAMKGEGYSSKVAMLLPLVERYFGREIKETFHNIFSLYVKTEYSREWLSEEEAKTAINSAKRILEVLYRKPG